MKGRDRKNRKIICIHASIVTDKTSVHDKNTSKSEQKCGGESGFCDGVFLPIFLPTTVDPNQTDDIFI